MQNRLLFALALMVSPISAIAQDTPTDATTAEEAPADPPAEPAGPVTYTVDSDKTVLMVRTYRGGIAGSLAHNHAIRSMKTSGSITWQEGGEGCKFDINVDVGSFRVDHTADRKLMGLEGEVSAGQVEDIKENMFAKDQLNLSAHKSMTFEASSCTGSSVSGTLTIVGKSASHKTPLKVTVEGDSLRAKGVLHLKHSDHGIEPYSTGFGAIANEDKLSMTIDLRANK
jgi:polyisoprenoid-binding protein YceI